MTQNDTVSIQDLSQITPRSSLLPPRQTLGSTVRCGVSRERASAEDPKEENARFRFRRCCDLYLPLGVLPVPRPRLHLHDAPPPLRARQEVVPRRRRNPSSSPKGHRRVLRRVGRPRPLPPRPQTLSNRRRPRFLRWQLHLPHQLPWIVHFILFHFLLSLLKGLFFKNLIYSLSSYSCVILNDRKIEFCNNYFKSFLIS